MRAAERPVVDSPLLTIVVIVFNDAERLPRAVRSALRQTLSDLEVVIVDDASTDATAQVATRLAAAAPDRVRAHRLEFNSGGCSRPRNTGIDLARGRYVMFLDSGGRPSRWSRLPSARTQISPLVCATACT